MADPARTPGRAAVLGMAAAAGYAVRVMRTMPGLLGAASIVWGAHLVYAPAAFLAGGVFLMLIDRATR